MERRRIKFTIESDEAVKRKKSNWIWWASIGFKKKEVWRWKGNEKNVRGAFISERLISIVRKRKY